MSQDQTLSWHVPDIDVSDPRSVILRTREVTPAGRVMMEGRILVVESDPQKRRIIRAALVSHGYEVTDARSGNAALKLIHSAKFDLILLGEDQHDLTGIETCQAIRAANSKIAIIFMITHGDRNNEIEALDAGADDVVRKPVDIPEVLARIRAALRRLIDARLPASQT